MKDLRDYFERVFVISLKRRPSRYAGFVERMKDWPYAPIELWPAADGSLLSRPTWWQGCTETEANGSWGCFVSHRQILEYCMTHEVKSYLVLEDDAELCPNFTDLSRQYIENLPEDWQMAYFGGQHLHFEHHPPEKVNPFVYRPYNINRTHAFALRREGMRNVYSYLHARHWVTIYHIDHHLGKFHENRHIPCYCPAQWLVRQTQDFGDITPARVMHDLLAAGAEELYETYHPRGQIYQENQKVRIANKPFVAVIGLHSSGSSAIAGLLHHLGVNLGDQLTGYYGSDPNGSCGFEAVGLVQICESYIKLGDTKPSGNRKAVYDALSRWIASRIDKTSKTDSLAGGKYPTLCQMDDMLLQICGDNLLVVNCERPLDDSVESLSRRCPQIKNDVIREHQAWLQVGKDRLLKAVPPERQVTINYYEMLKDPQKAIDEIVKFLKLTPTAEQIEKALKSIKPAAKHVG